MTGYSLDGPTVVAHQVRQIGQNGVICSLTLMLPRHGSPWQYTAFSLPVVVPVPPATAGGQSLCMVVHMSLFMN